MTSQTNAPDGAPGARQSDGTPARRRMAGYTPKQQEHGSAVQPRPDGGPRTDGGPAAGPGPISQPDSSVDSAPAADATPTSGDGAMPTAAAQTAHSSAGPVRKTRMGGAPQPLAAPAPTASAPEPGQTPVAVSQAPGPVTTSGGNTAIGATAPPAGGSAGGASTPPKRTRMGGAPATPAAGSATPTGGTAGGTAGGQADTAPAGRTRMGAGATGAGNRQRMGGAGQAQTSGASASTVPGASKTRMGGAAATPTTPVQPATAASTAASGAGTAETTGTPMAASASPPAAPASPAASATATASSGRAGTPGPAGAATAGAGRPAWVKPVLVIAGLVIVALVVVLAARWLRTLEGVQEFIATYDGHASQPESAPVGIPGWLGWQHFFNMFFIVLIIRTGLQVRTERKPPGYWTAKPDSFFSPKGNTPKKVSVTQWLHQCLDVLWVVNGVIFVVLLFATGHWMRIVPTSWDIVPNMASAGLQYASLDWPVENGWVHYNALQVMAYFLTVFIAAPLAIATGIRISTWWPARAERLTKVYPVEIARAVHFPVMLYFVAFTIVHVFLVFFTGALANLNHMYTSRDVVDWWGLIVFLASLIVLAAAWFLTKPLFTTPLASRMGKVTK